MNDKIKNDHYVPSDRVLVRSPARKVIFYAILIGLSLLSIEAVVRIICLSSPSARLLIFSNRAALYVADPILGHRPNSVFPDHDARGFRNETVPDAIDILALGDSQTYGSGVRREHAWPQQLAKLTGLTTYNMAFGGYGPAHYLLLLPEVISLHPKMVIMTFYSGNDLYDAFRVLYYNGKLRELRTRDLSVLRAMKAAEDAEALEAKSYRLANSLSTSSFIPVADFSPLTDTASLNNVWRYDDDPSNASRTAWWRNTAVFGLARAAGKMVRGGARAGTQDAADWESAVREADRHPEVYQAFDGGPARTVFMSQYRMLAVDQRDPRISEGMRVSFEAIRRVRDALQEKNIAFRVLCVPTTELVFEREVIASRKHYPDYEKLITQEKGVWEKMRMFLLREGIAFTEALPALQRALDKGQQPYPSSANGHPNAYGQRRIAELLAEQIQPARAR